VIQGHRQQKKKLSQSSRKSERNAISVGKGEKEEVVAFRPKAVIRPKSELSKGVQKKFLVKYVLSKEKKPNTSTQNETANLPHFLKAPSPPPPTGAKEKTPPPKNKNKKQSSCPHLKKKKGFKK